MKTIKTILVKIYDKVGIIGNIFENPELLKETI